VMEDQLQPEGLPTDLHEYTKGFTGRAWVFQRIDQWVSSGTSRSYLVVGGPGAGKTAIAARLVEMSQGEVTSDGCAHLSRGFLFLAHFCRVLDPGLDPLRFVERLSGQLAAKYPAFRSALLETDHKDISIEGRVEAVSVETGAHVTGVQVTVKVGNPSPQVAFDRLIRRPLEVLSGSGLRDEIIVLVDGLDEALTYPADENLAVLLAATVNPRAGVPDTLRFLLTSRPDERVLGAFGHPDLDLLADAPADLDDVRLYAKRRLHGVPDGQEDELAERVARAGEGNFLYARYAVDEILAGHDPAVLKLPTGLPGIYAGFLERELARSRERWQDRYRVVLGILAVARGEGLTAAQVAGASRLEEDRVDDTLRTSAQYLVGPDPESRYRIYHHSFREFLLTDQSFKVYPALANRKIADYCLQLYGDDWTTCMERYALAHTPAHIIEAISGVRDPKQQRTLTRKLTALLTNLAFLEVKTRLIGIDIVLGDFQMAKGIVPAEERSVHQVSQVLDRQAHHLRRWDSERLPAYFSQQVCIGAVGVGAAALVNATRKRLQSLRSPYIEHRWRSGSESHALKGTLSGHAGSVAAVAVTPDGRWAVSASSDKTLKVWDLHTGAEIRTLSGQYRLGDMVVTHDGRRAVSSAARTGILQVWDLKNGIEIQTLQGEGDWIRTVAVSPGAGVVVSVSHGVIRVWDLEAGIEARAMPSHGGQVDAVAISPDGQRAVSGGHDGSLKVWDLESGTAVKTLAGHGDWVTAVAITPDGRRAVSAARDNNLKLWDLETSAEVLTMSGHGRTLIPHTGDSVNAVAITPDGRQAVSGANDGTLRVWDLRTGVQLATLSGHGGPVFAVAITPDGRSAVSGSWDGTLKIWDLQPSAEIPAQTGHSGPVKAVAITPNGRLAVSGSYDGTLKVWDQDTGAEVRTLPGHGGSRVGAVAVTPDGHQAVSGALEGTLKVWDLVTGAEVRTLSGQQGLIAAVAVTPDGRRAVSCATVTLRVWDLKTGVEIWTKYASGLAMALTPDGRRAVSGGLDGKLEVWNLPRGGAKHLSVNETVWAVAITPDSRTAVLGLNDGTMKLWDIDTGAEIGILSSHTRRITAAAVTPDGRRIISGSDDQTLKIWDLNSGEVLAIASLDRAPAAIAIAPDSYSFVVGDDGGSLYGLRYVADRATDHWAK
jgi:WD40 repeat protein